MANTPILIEIHNQNNPQIIISKFSYVINNYDIIYFWKFYSTFGIITFWMISYYEWSLILQSTKIRNNPAINFKDPQFNCKIKNFQKAWQYELHFSNIIKQKPRVVLVRGKTLRQVQELESYGGSGIGSPAAKPPVLWTIF